MNAKQALSRAKKLYGVNAAVRDSGKPSTPEMRQEATAALRELNAVPKEQQDEEWRKARDSARYVGLHYRCAVGKIFMGIAFSVTGLGDNFAEAIEAAERDKVV